MALKIRLGFLVNDHASHTRLASRHLVKDTVLQNAFRPRNGGSSLCCFVCVMLLSSQTIHIDVNFPRPPYMQALLATKKPVWCTQLIVKIQHEGVNSCLHILFLSVLTINCYM